MRTGQKRASAGWINTWGPSDRLSFAGNESHARYEPSHHVVGSSAVVPYRRAAARISVVRTHFDVNVNYYRERNRAFDFTTQIFLAQLHLYL